MFNYGLQLIAIKQKYKTHIWKDKTQLQMPYYTHSFALLKPSASKCTTFNTEHIILALIWFSRGPFFILCGHGW